MEFYRRCGVRELLVADPARRSVRCYGLQATTGLPDPVPRSQVLDLATADLEAGVAWPTGDGPEDGG